MNDSVNLWLVSVCIDNHGASAESHFPGTSQLPGTDDRAFQSGWKKSTHVHLSIITFRITHMLSITSKICDFLTHTLCYFMLR